MPLDIFDKLEVREVVFCVKINFYRSLTTESWFMVYEIKSFDEVLNVVRTEF